MLLTSRTELADKQWRTVMILRGRKKVILNRPIVNAYIHWVQGKGTRQLVLFYPTFSQVFLGKQATREAGLHTVKHPNCFMFRRISHSEFSLVIPIVPAHELINRFANDSLIIIDDLLLGR